MSASEVDIGNSGRGEETMYAILGATGHTGSVVAEKLLAKGQKVRVVGRDTKRLDRFTKNGAEAVAADATDAASLAKAFSGAHAIYALIPPNVSAPNVLAYSARVSDALAAAIEKSGVTHAVILSSYGAEKPDGTGPVIGLHHLEKKLNTITRLNAVYLRAGYFMENILSQTDVIRNMGNMAGPVLADLPLPMIATRDIGAAAAEILLKLDFHGKTTRELQGLRDVSYSEVAKVVGAAIGKPDLVYKQAPAGALKPVLTQMGMSANFVDLLLEMCDALNSGYMKMQEPRSPANSTSTTIETFVVEVFVPAYRGEAARA
jgi:uncharacterized protein YbjT (DUF2867 family)